MIAPEVVYEPGLTPGQAELLDDVETGNASQAFKLILCVGGNGASKTRGLALKTLQLAQMNPGLPVVSGMPTIPMLEDITIPEMFAALDDMGFVDGPDYEFERRRRILRVNFEEGTGIIRFRPTTIPRRIVGGNVAAFVLDEAEDNSREAFNEICRRVRHPRARCRQLVVGGTPESLGGWFYEEAEGSKRPGTHVIRLRTAENHFLPEGYVAGLASRFDETERRLYLEGEFVARQGRVYTHFDQKTHLRPIADASNGEQIMACDFGRGCMAWVFGRVLDPEVHFHGEQILEQSDTWTAGILARQWWRDFFQREAGIDFDDFKAAQQVTAYVDPAGEMKGSISDVRVLRELGFNVRFHAKHPRIKDRVNAVQEKLHRRELLIDDERCPLTARNIATQVYDKHGMPEKARPREGKKGRDHSNDAIGYLVEFLWPASSSGAVVH